MLRAQHFEAKNASLSHIFAPCVDFRIPSGRRASVNHRELLNILHLSVWHLHLVSLLAQRPLPFHNLLQAQRVYAHTHKHAHTVTQGFDSQR